MDQLSRLQEFFSLISNTAGGYCFYRDAKLQRILRYRYNNVPADVGGRFFYIKEEDKAPWSPTFHPVDRSLDSYRCRHGMGYTVFETEKDGLYAELTFLVPIGENCEVQRVRLTNRSAETKRFRFTAAVEWCLWNTVDDTTNFQRNLNIRRARSGRRAQPVVRGVKPTPAGLQIAPCLPGALEEYSVRRRYRGAAYHIHVVQTGTYSLRVDGENVAGNLIPMKDGEEKVSC